MKTIMESLLEKHLGKYIDGLTNNLTFGLDGKIIIENVSLKTSFVNQLGLPFTLKFSHVERIHIDIPWTSLKEKNAQVSIRGIYALLNVNFQEKEGLVNSQEVLKGITERIRVEMKRNWKGSGSKDESFAVKKLIQIIDNAVISISQIHLRVESLREGCQFSGGVIMDQVSSRTVDQEQQPYFYQRNKQHNEPFHKVINVRIFKVYLNDNQTTFLCQHFNDAAGLRKLMRFPFLSLAERSSVGDEKQVYPCVMRVMLQFQWEGLLSQTFAEDMRYNVMFFNRIVKADFSVSNGQIAKLAFLVQHFYDFGLNIDKHGRKRFVLEQSHKKQFSLLIQTIARGQPVTEENTLLLHGFIREVPLSILDSLISQTINKVRVEAELHRISKESSPEKSKQMMDELYGNGVKLKSASEVFSNVSIQTKIDKITVCLCNQEEVFGEIGLLGNSVDWFMDLKGFVSLKCKVLKGIVRYQRKQTTEDHYDPILPWVQISCTSDKKVMTELRVYLQMKEVNLEENFIIDLLHWISKVRVRPTMLSYLQQQMHFTVARTKNIVHFLTQEQCQIKVQLALPTVRLVLNEGQVVQVILGQLEGEHKSSASTFELRSCSGVGIEVDSIRLAQIGRGSSMTVGGKTQRIELNLQSVQVWNMVDSVRVLLSLRNQGRKIIQKYLAMDLSDDSWMRELPGIGMVRLNKVKALLKAQLKQTYLELAPEDGGQQEQRISLSKVRLYKLVTSGQCYLVLKDQTTKQVNFIQVDTPQSLQKMFTRVRAYIHEICTSTQWYSFHAHPYTATISSFQDIHDACTTNPTVLAVSLQLCNTSIQPTANSNVQVLSITSEIVCKEYGKIGSVELKGVGFQVEGEAVIGGAWLRGKYEGGAQTTMELQVLRLPFRACLHSTVSKVIQMAAEYQVLIYQLGEGISQQVGVQQDEGRQLPLHNEQGKEGAAGLLESKLVVKGSNIEVHTIGYLSKCQSFELLFCRHRNQPSYACRGQAKGLVLMGMIRLPFIVVNYSLTQLLVSLSQVHVSLNLPLLLLETNEEEGKLVLQQLLQIYKNWKIEKQMAEQLPVHSNSASFFPKVTVKFLRVNLSISPNLCLGILAESVILGSHQTTYDNVVLELNRNTVSTVPIHGSIGWTKDCLLLVLSTIKLRLSSQQLFFAGRQIQESYRFLTNQECRLFELVQAQLQKPDCWGRRLSRNDRALKVQVGGVELEYRSTEGRRLMLVVVEPLVLKDREPFTSVSASVWHFNSKVQLYESVLEPLQVELVWREGNQIDCYLADISLVATQQMIQDFMDDLSLLGKKDLSPTQSNLLWSNPQAVQLLKEKLMQSTSQQYSVHKHYISQQNNPVLISLTNYLGCKAIVEISMGKQCRETLVFEEFEEEKLPETKTISIGLQASQHLNPDLLERYKKINIRICIMNCQYSAKTITIPLLLHDIKAKCSYPLTLIDPEGQEYSTALSIDTKYEEGIYLLKLLPKYSIVNQLTVPLYLSYPNQYQAYHLSIESGRQAHLPIWINEYINFGVDPEDLTYLLTFNSKEEGEEGGVMEWWIERGEGVRLMGLIRKQIGQTPPALHKIGFQKQQGLPESKIQITKQKSETCTFTFLPAMLVRNHLQFPISINATTVQSQQSSPLLHAHHNNHHQTIQIALGDGTLHQCTLGPLNSPQPTTLKLAQQNYPDLWLLLRKNRLGQLVLHLYSEVHLMVNVQGDSVPILRTHIYGHTFTVKKEVCNGWTDQVHPAPLFRDKFVFNTLHYLLSLDQKYISLKCGDKKSQQIVVYHSDFDSDLTFQGQGGVFAVSYETRVVELQKEVEGSQPEFLECHFTYIMPKYYLLNLSEETLVVEGNALVHEGERICIDLKPNFILEIRERSDLTFLACSLLQTNHLMFIRTIGCLSLSSHQMNRQSAEIQSEPQVGIAEQSSELPLKGAEDIEAKPQPNLSQNNGPRKEKGEESLYEAEENSFQGIEYRIKMEDLVVLSLKQRKCQYNTVGFQVHNWHEWLVIQNQLKHSLMVRVKLREGVLGEQVVESTSSAAIISGLSDFLQVCMLQDHQQVLVGYFDLRARLNHQVILQGGKRVLLLREFKTKVGRSIAISSRKAEKDRILQKARLSLNVYVGKLTISLMVNQQKTRPELVRLTLNSCQLLLLCYPNGLYFGHFQLDTMQGLFKRMLFLLVGEVRVGCQAFEGQFIERLSMSLGNRVGVMVTDEIVGGLLEAGAKLMKYLPGRDPHSVIQDEQTYPINSLQIEGLEIKLSLKKTNYQQRSAFKLLEQLFTVFQIEETRITLSSVSIQQPLKKKHINSLIRNYLQEIVVGVTAGLNLLGSPTHLVAELQEGLHRGFFPFFRALLAGLTNSLSKIIGTVGTAITQLTFDEELRTARIKSKNARPESLGIGLKMGLAELRNSLKSTVTGLIVEPMQGGRREGGVGVLKGTALGLTGLVTKPVSGIILAVAKTMEGLSASSSYLDYGNLLGRQLLYRPLYHKFQIVRPYTTEDELCYNVLLDLYGGEKEVGLVRTFRLDSEEGSPSNQLLAVTCDEVVVIDEDEKEVCARLGFGELVATGSFLQGVVVYMRDGLYPEGEQEMVFRLSAEEPKSTLYLTLKSFIELYSQDDI